MEDIISKLPLDPDQLDAYNILLKKYNNINTPVQLLPADTGWGKTRVITRVAHKLYNQYNLQPFIICPANLRLQWIKIMQDSNLPYNYIFSYDQIRISKHPFLIKSKTGKYFMTQQWKNICHKLFIIFDESQLIKNKTSARHMACFELIKQALKIKDENYMQTRIAFLTACSIDKHSNWETLYRNFGISKKNLLQSNINYIYEYGCKLNKDETIKIINPPIDNDFSTQINNKILHTLWINVFREHFVINVIDPIYVNPNNNIPYKRNRINGFYSIDKNNLPLIEKGIKKIKSVFYDENDKNNINIAKLQSGLIDICKAKVPTIIKIALKDLNKDNYTKIILCIPFLDDQLRVFEALEEFKPLLLNGKIQFNERVNIINKFNEHNSIYRIIIMTPQVGGVGISLHDTHGKFPRNIYILPTFHFQDMFQTTGRTYRRGLRSDTFVCFIYGNNSLLEPVISNTLAKTTIAHDVMIPGSGRKFPGNFKIFIENEQQFGLFYKKKPTLENTVKAFNILHKCTKNKCNKKETYFDRLPREILHQIYTYTLITSILREQIKNI